MLGRPVRYDGSAKTFNHAKLLQWEAGGLLVPVCPEMLAGFSTPRPPAEIHKGRGGFAVLDGRALIFEETGEDVTSAFIDGAERVLEIALKHHCQFALLTDGSPSCGSSFIYDGSFAGRHYGGEGVTTALLRRNGIQVYSPESFTALATAVEEIGRS